MYLTSLTWHNVFHLHPCYSVYQNFLPFYGQITFHCMDMPCLFIHSSIICFFGLGFFFFFFFCFTNNAAVNQFSSVQFSSVTQSCQTLCDPMNAARQAFLSITNSQSSLKLTSIKSVMPSTISSSVVPSSSCPQSLPASESFPMSQLFT